MLPEFSRWYFVVAALIISVIDQFLFDFGFFSVHMRGWLACAGVVRANQWNQRLSGLCQHSRDILHAGIIHKRTRVLCFVCFVLEYPLGFCFVIVLNVRRLFLCIFLLRGLLDE